MVPLERHHKPIGIMMDWMYWEVNGRTTHSKMQALMWANGDPSKINFYFCDNEWRDEDFLKEPEESFEKLALDRCHDIRNSYDFLTLWLSSGYDSVTVLEYFKISRNRIDELIIYKRCPLWDGKKWIEDIEYQTALKIAQEYKDKFNPKCVITFHEVKHDHMVPIYDKLKSDWVFEPGMSIRFHKYNVPYQMHHHDAVKFRIGETERKGVITGWDKPKVLLYQNKWYSFFVDINLIDVPLSDRLVHFWTHRDAFKLWLKQHYMIIKWYESLPDLDEQLVHDVQNHKKYYRESNLACGRIPVYNEWSTEGKGKHLFSQLVAGPACGVYLDHFKNSKTLTHYMDGISIIKSILPGWKTNEDINKITVLSSKKRYIRDRIFNDS